MRRFLQWLKWISFAAFLIDWGVLGIELAEGNSGSAAVVAAAYIGAVCFAALFLSILILILTNRCPYCKRILPLNLNRLHYCPHCGKKLND